MEEEDGKVTGGEVKVNLSLFFTGGGGGGGDEWFEFCLPLFSEEGLLLSPRQEEGEGDFLFVLSGIFESTAPPSSKLSSSFTLFSSSSDREDLLFTSKLELVGGEILLFFVSDEEIQPGEIFSFCFPLDFLVADDPLIFPWPGFDLLGGVTRLPTEADLWAWPSSSRQEDDPDEEEDDPPADVAEAVIEANKLFAAGGSAPICEHVWARRASGEFLASNWK